MTKKAGRVSANLRDHSPAMIRFELSNIIGEEKFKELVTYTMWGGLTDWEQELLDRYKGPSLLGHMMQMIAIGLVAHHKGDR